MKIRSIIKTVVVLCVFSMATPSLSTESLLSYKHIQSALESGEVQNEDFSAMSFSINYPINNTYFIENSISTLGFVSFIFSSVVSQETPITEVSLGMGRRYALTPKLDSSFIASYLRLNDNSAFTETNENAVSLTGRLRFYVNSKVEMFSSIEHAASDEINRTKLSVGSLVNISKVSLGVTFQTIADNSNALAFNFRRNY